MDDHLHEFVFSITKDSGITKNIMDFLVNTVGLVYITTAGRTFITRSMVWDTANYPPYTNFYFDGYNFVFTNVDRTFSSVRLNMKK